MIVTALVFASLSVMTGTAVAHTGNVISADCTTVSGSFQDFSLSDHPIWFQVSVQNGPWQQVAAVEDPSNFVGSGTASADISALTAVLQGSSGSVAVFAQWNAGRTTTATFTVTCGGPPPTTTTTSPPPTTTTSPPPTTTTSPPPTTTTPPPIHPTVHDVPVAPPAVPTSAAPTTTG